MASESTPLIQTVRVRPSRQRYPHSTCRRFFTIASCCILISGFTTFLVHALLLWPYKPHHGHRHGHHGRFSGSSLQGHSKLSHEELEAILLNTPSPEKAEEWLRYYTAGPHLAGKNLSQAEWTRDRWEEFGIKSEVVPYECYINYPLSHSLSLLEKSKKADAWDTLFEASLEEDIIDEDPTTALENRIPTFHGYSASGNVTGSFVYVNYGTYQDYEDLVDAGVDLQGKIAIARYGGIFRGLKVKRAQELGMIGTLIYSDPGDDGGITEENGYKYYPDGPARHPHSVQRGSVQFLSSRPGDPTTPGYPSKPGVPRAPANESTPSIPSIPISYTDALPILRALNGHGPKSSDFNKYWTMNEGLHYKGVEYNIGPSPDSVVLNLDNQQEYTITPQWDVIGIVNGTVPNEVLIVGNHRDAWIAGGAGDPNSGSAALNEAVRAVGKALEAGWKPLRTIVFASWDGEEYGLIGSTEWVEEYLPWIQDANVAYLNVDVAVSGPQFEAGATPTLNQVVRDAAARVQSANQTVPGQTVADLWHGAIGTLGSGSDFTAFQDYAGVPCINLGFSATKGSNIYHYHSNYDSFHWMDKYGDPGFEYHKVMAQLMGLVIANLVDSIVIPFSAAAYAEALHEYLDTIDVKFSGTVDPDTEQEIFEQRSQTVVGNGKGLTMDKLKQIWVEADTFQQSLVELRNSISHFHIKALEIDELADWANRELEADIPWWNIVRKFKLARAIIKVNPAFKQLERNFLFEGGLDGRDWFKHVVYAPGLWTGYSGAVFPGLTESVVAHDYMNALKWSGIIRSCVEKAAKSIS